MRITKQKKILLDALAECSSFFSVEELQELVKTKNQNMGIATIYRFLKKSEESGKVHSYICNNRKIYSTHTKNHIHFICERCLKIHHIHLAKADFLQKNIPGKSCHFQLNISGICTQCLTQKET
ncbi:TPA: transcriptional repressor [Candidatus Woesearchaeota archaeon]|nr:transcriptional repressor [Candidatus Woesearchaeota archaeon]